VVLIVAAVVTWRGLPFTPTASLGAAPGPSAATDTWTTGDKDAIGTAYERTSPIWFTAVHGAIADVLYPTVDQDNVKQFGYLVTDGTSFVFDETRDGVAYSVVTDDRVLTYRTVVRDPKHGFSLEHEFATDPARSVLLERTRISGAAGLHVYAYLVPHLRDSGLGQSAGFDGEFGWVSKEGRWLVAGGAASGSRVAGYLRRNDGLAQLSRFQIANQYTSAGEGRVTLTWEVDASKPWTEGIAFGGSRSGAENSLRASLGAGFDEVLEQYGDGWRRYIQSTSGGQRYPPLWFHSLQVIKMAEDKTHPGAIVASLALPWGDHVEDDPIDVGYRKVWPRDLYHAARSLIAAGDVDTAMEVARFMRKQQQPDGSMSQNTDLTGTRIWEGQQLDETADAVLLSALFANLLPADQRPNIAAAADFIATHGPQTQQERWEENSGYSPATIAAEIAALRVAGLNSLANQWSAKLESWTYSGQGWYVRISPSGHPDAVDDVTLANNGGVFPQQFLVDQSFLELVRLGVRGPKDPRVISTLAATDEKLRVRNYFYRYPFDGYGELTAGGTPPGLGHLWPLLSGERGVYTVLAGGDPFAYVDAMTAAAGSEQLIPEQVWQDTALPTGSARPLVWAHAEYVILASAMATGVVADSPNAPPLPSR